MYFMGFWYGATIITSTSSQWDYRNPKLALQLAIIPTIAYFVAARYVRITDPDYGISK